MPRLGRGRAGGKAPSRSTRGTRSTARRQRSRATISHATRASLDADAERQPGLLDVDLPLAASLGHDVVDLDGVRAELAADALGGTDLPRRLAVDEHVI